eukprot:2626567-Alexandrium_andersonii.AAC.1
MARAFSMSPRRSKRAWGNKPVSVMMRWASSRGRPENWAPRKCSLNRTQGGLDGRDRARPVRSEEELGNCALHELW